MSSIDDEEIENTPTNGTYEKKPKYVKRLNFGKSILNLNTIDRSNICSRNTFIIDKNVARIPYTEKEDFVRRWIEAHNCNIDLSNGSNQSSPVLGESKFKQVETSPILGFCNYRNRTRSKTDDNVTEKEVYNCIQTSPVLGGLKGRYRRKLHFTSEKKQANVHKDGCESVRSDPLFTKSRCDNLPNANVNSSPILIKDTYYYKRKRRRIISENDCDKNMNLLVPLNASQKTYTLSPEIHSSTANCRIKNGKNNRIYDKEKNATFCPSPPLTISEENKIGRNSSKGNTSHVIESVSSNDSDTKDISSNHDNDINDIEDIDTQEAVPLTKTPAFRAVNKWIIASPKSSDGTFYSEPESNKHKIFFEMKNKEDIASSKDSDKTFFSKAESALSVPSMLPSNTQDKISQATVLSSDSVDCRSSQTNFTISNVTSPVRTNSWQGMSFQIIDSCKKKRRFKKNSLAGKLQTLITRQTSFIRIWHHQMKQADMDGTSVPHIVVYINKCMMYFYRQILKGIVLDDPFNILYNESNEKSNISESSSTKQSNKMITMFIVPEIVGKIEMKDKSIIKVYPPWDTMDESKMILNVTYIKVVSNEQRNFILSKTKMSDRKEGKILIKEFNCPCIETDKMLSSCEKRLNGEKPDVMEELFKF